MIDHRFHGHAEDADLATSLFTSDFSSALEKQRATLIEHCETKFEKKSNKVTRVDTLEYTKHITSTP
jgi:hypothetical protein